MFRDKVRLEVSSGNGGNGVVSFRKEKNEPRGGPDGGDGGQGGSVYLVASPRTEHLGHINKMHYRAEHGGSGEAARRKGRDGTDLYIEVPVNTQVWVQLRDDEAVPTQIRQNLPQKVERGHHRYVLIKDLDHAEQYCLATGGAGGVGNAQYTSAIYQAPNICKTGQPGVTKTVQLRMRLAAHFGLLGAPNAGKSSLLAALTNARPIVADYPFTTIHPQIGITPGRSSVIDIPGLIEGAHQDRGLGHEFLDHVAKCSVLICVLDVTDNPETTYGMLISEITAYDAELAGRIKLAVLNKVDLLDGPLDLNLGIPSIPTSTVTQEGINELLVWLDGALREERGTLVDAVDPRWSPR